MKKVMVKIGLKQKDDKEEIVVEVLLNSGITVLVMSSEFARKNKFKKKKLERPIYEEYRWYHEGLIEHIVEVELFYKGHKERTKIDVIKD